MKKGCNVFILFCLAITAKCQVFVSGFPQLNSGGQVNAVWEDTLANITYVAGNFTTVNGNSRRNLAAFSTSTNILLTSFNPISSMSGEIFAMIKSGNYLYIAGNFSSVNGNSALHFLQRINLNTNNIDPIWNPNPSASVNDLKLDGNKIYACGEALVVDDLMTGDTRLNFAAFDAANGALSNFDPSTRPLNASFNWGSMQLVKLHVTTSRIYLCGKTIGGAYNQGIIAISKSTGDVITSFNPVFSFQNVIDCETYNGKIAVLNSKIWPGGYALMYFDEITSAQTSGAFVLSGSGSAQSIERYKNNLFVAGTFQNAQNASQLYLAKINLNNFQLQSWTPNPNTGIDNIRALHRIRNHLYISDNNLSSIAGQSQIGIAKFCLEPHNVGSISLSATTICPGQTGIVASINAVPYANTYQWFYTGSGIQLIGSGNSIQINANMYATSGQLQVVAQSSCGLSSDTAIISLTILTPPNAYAGMDSTLTCTRTSLQLNGTSSSANCNYTWMFPNNQQINGISTTANLAGNYVFIVTDTISTCFWRDTLQLTLDTIRPSVILPTGPFELTCQDTNLILFGNSATLNSALYWRKWGGGLFQDPMICNSIGQYYLVVENTINGCKDSAFVTVSENLNAPSIYLLSHNESLFTIDTLTCNTDSVLIIGTGNSSNLTFGWRDTLGTVWQGDSIWVDTIGVYFFTAIDNYNGCYAEFPIAITSNYTLPNIGLLTDSLFFNCSVDSVLLNTNETIGNTYYWSQHNQNFNNPCYVDSIGWATIHVTKSDNGCVNRDSIYVGFRPQLLFSSLNDTMVCAGSALSITAHAIYPNGNVNYIWNSGVVDSTNAAIINANQLWIVEASNGMCFGTDSISVSIPPTPLITSQSFTNCNPGAGDGSLYLSTQGGLAPFVFSIVGSNNFQGSPLFDSLNFGNYDFIILDSLQCTYFYSASLLNTGQIPEPNFYAATLNQSLDTIALVNVSNPLADSIHWEVPISFQSLGFSSGMSLFKCVDTGYFTITLHAWFSGCESELQKLIYVGDRDSLKANWNTKTKILHHQLFPNPNSGQFNVDILFEGKQNCLLSLTDVHGYTYWNKSYEHVSAINEQITISGLLSGTYILRILTPYAIATNHLIIQN